MSIEAKKIMNQVRLFPVSVALNALSVALSALSSVANSLDDWTMISVELCTDRYPPDGYATYLRFAFSQSRIAGLGVMNIPIVTPKTPKVVSSSVSVPFQISVPYSSVVHQRMFNCVDGVADETGCALSGVTVIGPIVQFPLARLVIGASTIIVNGVLSVIFACPINVTFTFTESKGVGKGVGNVVGSQKCMNAESLARGGGSLGDGGLLMSKCREAQVGRSGFVASPITKQHPDASQKTKATAMTLLLLGVVDTSYCFVLKYSPRTARTVSGIVSNFLALRSASSALSISSDTDSIIFFIAIFDNDKKQGEPTHT